MATKKCPYCAEEIQKNAILCRYCGSKLDPVSWQDSTNESVLRPEIITSETKCLKATDSETNNHQEKEEDSDYFNLKCEEMQGTSTAPVVLGIIGGLLNLPFAIYSSFMWVAMENIMFPWQWLNFLVFFLIVPSANIGAIHDGINSKYNPNGSGKGLIFTFITNSVIMGGTLNFIGGIFNFILLIGGIICLAQNKVYVDPIRAQKSRGVIIFNTIYSIIGFIIGIIFIFKVFF